MASSKNKKKVRRPRTAKRPEHDKVFDATKKFSNEALDLVDNLAADLAKIVKKHKPSLQEAVRDLRNAFRAAYAAAEKAGK